MKLVMCVVLWEILCVLLSVMVCKTYGVMMREEEKCFVAAASAYVMLMLYVFVVVIVGLKIGYIMVMLLNVNDWYYLYVKIVFKLVDLKFIERWNWVFCGYMFGDLLYVLKEYLWFGKMDMVVYYVCFIVCLLFVGYL